MIFPKLNLHPTAAELRAFGYVVLGACAVVCAFWLALRWWYGSASIVVLVGCVVFSTAVGLPAILGWRLAAPFQIAWIALGLALGFVMQRVITALVLYGLITPIGLIMRLAGRDALQLKRGTRKSMWTPIHHKSDPKSYERQS